MAKRTQNGRWAQVASGNPSGRPSGSRNQKTQLLEQLLEEDSEQVIRKLLDLAKKGNLHALRLVVERLLPPRKERTIELEARPCENSHELPVTTRDVLTAVAEGRITPGEGQALANIMSAHGQSSAASDLARRVEELDSCLDELLTMGKEPTTEQPKSEEVNHESVP